MNTIFVLFVPKCTDYLFSPLGQDGKTAFSYTVNAAVRISHTCGALRVLSYSGNASRIEKEAERYSVKVIVREEWRLADVLDAITDAASEDGASAAVFSYADCPFLDVELTQKLLECHERYSAEYTFADGYPYGFAPEIIDAGGAKILAQIAHGNKAQMGSERMERTAIWQLIKSDINSYQVETILSPVDYRLWRFAFHCGDKRGFMSCSALQDDAASCRDRGKAIDADVLAAVATADIRIVRTVPSYYEVEIDGCNATFMSVEKFSSIIHQAAALSGMATVSLSVRGEPLHHPKFIQIVEVASNAHCDLLVETSGVQVTEDIAKSVQEIIERAKVNITWIVRLDAVTVAMYEKVHGSEEADKRLDNAEAAVGILSRHFPNAVYPQMVRTRTTESEVEAFYRKWADVKSASGGKVLIQKYCNYCHALADEKPCDLSPLERNPCWHLRRDMVILTDGIVPLCRSRIMHKDAGDILGNAADEPLADIWKRMGDVAVRDLRGERDDKCARCDEYYTFNF